ncbi:MAG: hypothetical protein IPP81_19345 [Chitinophagaceae bacterium]|nr:hypothetical protein [Chitinophagaceae bacterium]
MPHENFHLSHSTEYILMALSTLLVIASILFAWFKFKNCRGEGEAKGFGKILRNKWYVDELCDAIVVQPLMALSPFFRWYCREKGIDGTVNGVENW